MRICKIESCNRKHLARGWCNKHYQNWKNTGNPIPTEIRRPRDMSLEDYLAQSTERNDNGSLLWQRHIQPAGHGKMTWKGKQRLVHRLAYELAMGEIPAGMVLHHVCQQPACCESSHMQPMTQSEHRALHHTWV